MAPTCDIQEGVLSSIFQVKRMSSLVYVTEIKFKITHIIYDSDHAGIDGRHDSHLPGQYSNFWMVYIMGVDWPRG